MHWGTRSGDEALDLLQYVLRRNQKERPQGLEDRLLRPGSLDKALDIPAVGSHLCLRRVCVRWVVL